MINSSIPIYLASKSPRRKKMLEIMGIRFKSLNVEMREIISANESPVKNVKRIAKEKCELASKEIGNGIIIAADTIVVVDQIILGKPKNVKDAGRILGLLSDRSHFVYTGFALLNTKSDKILVDYSKTKVYFKKLTSREIKEYISSGSPMDKAGAYGIQDDYGAVFVKKINGCYYNVLGFPVNKIYEGLKVVI